MTAAAPVLAAASGNIGVGLAGFLVIVGLIVAVTLLLRSMNRHLKKVPKEFDAPSGQEDAYPERPAADDPAHRDDH